MTKDIIKNAVTIVAHRFTNPIWMTFVCFWLVTNWKAVAFFFMSDFYIEERFKTLSMTYSDPWNLYLIPLMLTVLTLFGMPWLLVGYSILISKAKTRLATLKNNEEAEILKSAINLAEAKKEIALIESGTKDIDALTKEGNIARAENVRLSDLVVSLESKLKESNEKNVSQAASLKDAEEKAVQFKEKHEEASKRLKRSVSEVTQYQNERESAEKELEKIKTECGTIAQDMRTKEFSPSAVRDRLYSLSGKKNNYSRQILGGNWDEP